MNCCLSLAEDGMTSCHLPPLPFWPRPACPHLCSVGRCPLAPRSWCAGALCPWQWPRAGSGVKRY